MTLSFKIEGLEIAIGIQLQSGNVVSIGSSRANSRQKKQITNLAGMWIQPYRGWCIIGINR